MLNRGTFLNRLWKAHHALETLATNPDVALHLGVEGPESPVLQRGRALYDAAYDAYHKRDLMHGKALHAGRHCASLFEAARLAQARLTLLARVVVTTPSDRDRLGLNGRRPEALAAWSMQARLFHANLRAADRSLLAEVGVNDALLARADHLISQLETAYAAFVAAQAEARRATEVKAAAFHALAALMTRLTTMARGLEREVPNLVVLLRMGRDRRLNRGRGAAAADDQTVNRSDEVLEGEVQRDLESGSAGGRLSQGELLSADRVSDTAGDAAVVSPPSGNGRFTPASRPILRRFASRNNKAGQVASFQRFCRRRRARDITQHPP